MPKRPIQPSGPAIRAADPWTVGNPSSGRMHQLLSEDERARLSTIASIERFAKGEEIYRAGNRADAVFNIVSGIVKTYKPAGDGNDGDHISAFLFPQDVLGLSEEGHYLNSAWAISSVVAYKLPIEPLWRQLSNDAALELHVIVKLLQELRQTQRHALLLAERHALSRLAMFLQLMEQLQTARGEPTAEIYIPMARSDIADYIGMSLAAVSRAFHDMATRGIIQSRDRKHVKVLSRQAFEHLAAGRGAALAATAH